MNVQANYLGIEVARAAWSRPVWAITAAIASIAIGVVFAVLVIADAKDIQFRGEQLEAKGWGLISVSSAAGESVDALACSAATEVPGVLAVGAIGVTTQVDALGLDAGLGLTEVTGSVPKMVWPGYGPDISTSALLTPGFQALSGLSSGVLHVQQGGLQVPLEVTNVEGTGRYPAIDGGVLLPRGDVVSPSYCLVDVPRERVEAFALDLAAATASYGTLAVPVLSTADAAPTPKSLLQSHRDMHLPIAVAAFLFVMAVLRWTTTRRDRAIYRLLGFGRVDLWTMGIMDYALLLGVPWTSAFATVVAWSHLQGTSTHTVAALDFAIAMGASALVAVIFASLCAAGRNTHQFAPGT